MENLIEITGHKDYWVLYIRKPNENIGIKLIISSDGEVEHSSYHGNPTFKNMFEALEYIDDNDIIINYGEK